MMPTMHVVRPYLTAIWTNASTAVTHASSGGGGVRHGTHSLERRSAPDFRARQGYFEVDGDVCGSRETRETVISKRERREDSRRMRFSARIGREGDAGRALCEPNEHSNTPNRARADVLCSSCGERPSRRWSCLPESAILFCDFCHHQRKAERSKMATDPLTFKAEPGKYHGAWFDRKLQVAMRPPMLNSVSAQSGRNSRLSASRLTCPCRQRLRSLLSVTHRRQRSERRATGRGRRMGTSLW